MLYRTKDNSLVQFTTTKKEVAMKRPWLLCFIVLGTFLLSGLTTEIALAQNDVTFQVRMNIKMLEGTFRPDLGDIVTVPGDMNAWNNTADTLTDGNGDSIYTKTLSLPTGGITYKFFKTLRGSDWEGDPNRTYTVVAGPQTIPAVYFDRDSVYDPPTANVPVTFQVNMRVKMLEGTFQPGSGDFVRVPGDFNGWNTNADTLFDGNGDSIYTKTVILQESQSIAYKFYKTTRGGLDWEGDPNRAHTVPLGGGPIPVVYFDRDSVVDMTVNANVLWQTDMTGFLQLGWFAPLQGDTMQVRGGFNGWGGTPMDYNIFTTGTYEVVVPYSGAAGDLPHKYYADLDPASARIRFPGFENDSDAVRYEHPYTRGDGNRLFNLTPPGGNVETPLYWYADINPNGLLLNTTDSVTVTLRVNMGPATRDPIAFNPATDTVRLIFNDWMWKAAQAKIQGGTPASFPDLTMTATPDPNDTTYTVSFLVAGKAHYGIVYVYEFRQPGGVSSQEGAGLGAQNGRRTRYIQPLSPNTFPRNYTAPLDDWKKDAPMPVETPPYNPLAGVIDDPDPGIPAGFRLGQNYPNPFNPTTRIKYAISERAQVSLKVYNLLGQEVATLFEGEQQKGSYIALFEANKLSTGVYFYRLEAGKFTETRKMILLK